MNKEIKAVLMPQLGVNDSQVTVVEWLVKPGSQIARGDVLAIVETSKATMELESEHEGYFYPLADVDTPISIRDVIALVLPKPNKRCVAEYRCAQAELKAATETRPSGEARLTRKARELAEAHGVELGALPTDRIIRESDVRELLEAETDGEVGAWFDEAATSVAIYGASEGGIAVLECLLEMDKHTPVVFLDDAPHLIGSTLRGLPVRSGKDLEAVKAQGVGGICSHLADPNLRLRLLERTRAAGLSMPNVIHPRATVSRTVKMGAGNLIKAGAVIGAECGLGHCCIIDNGAIVPHHNRIGDGSHLAPGVRMGGGCTIGSKVIVGVGAALSPRLTIGDNVIIGTGSSVQRDLPDNVVVEVVPGRIVGERNV